MAKKRAIDMIAAERRRQVRAEGYTKSHDDTHENEDIARAAAVYAMPEIERSDNVLNRLWPDDWNFKPSPSDRIRELVKSGALIVAEIECLQRNP